MPSLQVFGRRWLIASDDFVLPGIVDLIIRLAWLIGYWVVIYWKNDSSLGCPEGLQLRIYLYGIFVILHLMVLSNLALVTLSASGPIMDTKSRRFVTPTFYIRVVLQIGEICWNILGSFWALSGYMNCTTAPEVVTFVKGLLVCTWVLLVFRCWHYYLVFDPMGKVELLMERASHDERNDRTWESRCITLCCSCGGKNPHVAQAFSQIGRIFGTMFEDDDLVVSDLVAGFILLFLKNEENRSKSAICSFKSAKVDLEIPVLSPPDLRPLPLKVKDQFPEIQEFNYFLKYALGIYSWPILIVEQNLVKKSFWRKCLLCCRPQRSLNVKVEGDNCCFCWTSSLMSIADVEMEDILHVSLNNKVYKTPFYVAKDQESKSIIISIRGTMSFADVITDMNGWPSQIEGYPADFKGHHGMVMCAHSVKDRLDKYQIVESLMARFPEYQLVITGQSLGAGTAVILAMLLYSKYPKLICYAYSPPAGLLSESASKFTENFVHSVVYGDDFVCRLTINSFEKMKHALVLALTQCKEPKYRIILGICSFLSSGGIPNLTSDESSTNSPCSSSEDLKNNVIRDSTPDPLIITQEENSLSPRFDVENNNEFLPISLRKRELRKKFNVEDMYLPGKILHILEHPLLHYGSHNKKFCDDYTGPRWKLVRGNRQDFKELIVSPRMIADHIPFRIHKALKHFLINYESTLNV